MDGMMDVMMAWTREQCQWANVLQGFTHRPHHGTRHARGTKQNLQGLHLA